MSAREFDLLVFDLDGVILSEEGYLDAAALTAAFFAKRLQGNWPADLPDPQAVGSDADIALLRERCLPRALVHELRARAVNSNWDKALATVLLFMLMRREGMGPSGAQAVLDLAQYRETGKELLDVLLAQAGGDAARADAGANGGLRRQVVDHFQACFLGDSEAQSEWLRTGLAKRERCMTDPVVMRGALRSLRAGGYSLGVGTGRPRAEAEQALRSLELWPLFDGGRIVTIDEVRQEEVRSGAPEGTLAKPNPFTFQAAVQGVAPKRVLVVGDSPADFLAARAAGLRFAGIGSRDHFPQDEFGEIYLSAVPELASWLSGPIPGQAMV